MPNLQYILLNESRVTYVKHFIIAHGVDARLTRDSDTIG